MAQEFAIRCTPADKEWPSYLVGDGSGEVRYLPTMDSAVVEAMELQDKTKSDVSYTVVYA